MNTSLSSPRLCAILCATLISSINVCVAEEAIKTYNAVYQVQFRGKIIGTSKLSVQPKLSQNTYRFSSSMTVKGILRLLKPKPIEEYTDFIYEQGRIRPIEFWSRDSNRGKKDDLRVEFNWEQGIATTTDEENVFVVELQADVLDRGSMQVAMMQDLAKGIEPGPYVLVDGDSLKTYRYTYKGETTHETPLGLIDTYEYIQQRDGSTRQTSIWVAPQLAYLPVRIEQKRNSETKTIFMLQGVEGLKK
ncbi:MAG: DUF3108 domain-containing protein [Gammaproteobacteria bacterium]